MGPQGVPHGDCCAYAAPVGGPDGSGAGPAAPAGGVPAPGTTGDAPAPSPVGTTNTIVIADAFVAVIAIIAALAMLKKPAWSDGRPFFALRSLGAAGPATPRRMPHD